MDIRVRGGQGCGVLTIRPLTVVTLLSLIAPSVHASEQAAPGRTTSRPIAALGQPGAVGGSTLYWSPTPEAARPGLTAEAAARFHLDRHRADLRVGRAVLAGARVRLVHDTGRGGIIVVLRPGVAGVELLRADVKVLMDRDHRLLAISGAPHPAAHAVSAQVFTRAPTTAIAAALRDLHGELSAARLSPTGVTRAGFAYYTMAPTRGLRLRRPARVKPVYFPVGDSLVPAHQVEVQVQPARGLLEVFEYIIAADDGRLLERNDLTASEAFTYRVFADPDGEHRPFDGPLEDFTPHPTGVPGIGPKAFNPPNLVTVEGLNHNPADLPDPWLAPGATETLGNNVDAYVDHTNPSGLNIDQNEFRASITAPGVFDRVYNILLEPLASQSQSMAAIVQLFYVNNWMHDWWYDSGFGEAAGNAQLDNYGRGGVGGDPIKAEAQDAALVGTRNNANMATPVDGESPVMQMYLWTSLIQNTLSVAPLDKSFTVTTAPFGPKNYDITAELVLMQDAGGMSVTDGCEDAVNNIAGKIVLIDRGNCTFETKSSKAQAAGAIGVLIANNVEGGLNMGVDNNVVDPTIPTQAVLKADGTTLKTALGQGTQTAHMVGSASAERDGTIDNMIVAHEWGHYLHHRLVDCGKNQCRAQSEGWGDFNALMMALREGDALDGVYASTAYATFDPSGYFGIRRVPYSIDPDKNALSLRHIGDGAQLPQNHPLGATGGANSEVHNAGEVWTTMMWEAYIALIEAHPDLTLDEARRLMGDYVVAGMIVTPTDPTYTEQRDGLLLAIHAADPDDFVTVAEAFATRGAGSCAVSPPRDSTTFVGVIEDFQLRANTSISAISLSDDLLSCDDDGVVDVGELGALRITVVNTGAAPTTKGSTVEILDPDKALILPDGPIAQLAALAPLEQAIAELPVGVDETLLDHLPLTITVRLTTPGGCQETFETFLRTDVNGDIVPASVMIDDAEVPAPVWVAGGTEEGEAVWSRLASPTGHVWHGEDIGRKSDTWLESPTLAASATDPLIISWEHRYSFEFSDNTFWDGGLVELSSDDGETWQDASVLVPKIAYNGAINSAANPLDKRTAYVNKNPSYPAMDPQVLDLGTAFADKKVKLRFRIGTDAAAGAAGWDIDNISFVGITNTPFASWIADQSECVVEETTGTDTGDTSSTGEDTGTGGTTSTSGTSTSGTTGGDTTAAEGSGTTTGTSGATTGTSGATDITGDTTEGVSAGSSGTSTDPTAPGTSGFTTGSFTTGSFTTGGEGESGPQETGETPTSTPTESGSQGGDSSGSGASSTGAETGEVVTGDGCGCATDGRDERPWLQVLPWLGLIALGRRRRSMR